MGAKGLQRRHMLLNVILNFSLSLYPVLFPLAVVGFHFGGQNE